MLFRPGIRFVALAAGGVLLAGCHTRLPDPERAAAVSADSAGAPALAGTVEVTSAADGDESPDVSTKQFPFNSVESDAGKDAAEAHAHYGTAIIYELDDQPELALQEYYEAASKDLNNEPLVLDVSRHLIQAKKLDQAQELLLRATARRDASGPLFARLGVIYFQLEKPELAISANRTAIRREPQSLVGYQNLYLIYQQRKQMKEALGVLDEGAKVPRTSAEFQISLGELYGSFGLQVPAQKETAFSRGLALLQRARTQGVTDPQLQLRLANGFNQLGKEDEAAQVYQELLKHLPDEPQIREGVQAKLADIYLRDRDHKRAVEQLENIIRDNPTDPQAYYFLGNIAFDDTNYTQAAECFSKVVLLSPDFRPAYFDLASAQLSADKPVEALSTLDTARQKFPQSFQLEYLTAVAYSHQQDHTNAVNHFTAAEIVAQAGEPRRLTHLFYFQFGASCEREGDYQQAEKNFQKCLDLSPNFSEAQNYLGYMWADRGEKLDRARELIDRALKTEPKNAAFLDSMGWVLFKLNQPKAALDYMLDAIKNSEEQDATLYDHLGDIYSALKQPNEARDAWRKSLAVEKNESIEKKLEQLK
jgi:tetratricopeptide (TPR) repeat protein